MKRKEIDNQWDVANFLNITYDRKNEHMHVELNSLMSRLGINQ